MTEEIGLVTKSEEGPMFRIDREENGVMVIEKEGLMGGNVALEQDDLSKLLEWLKDGPYGEFTGHSIQVLNNKKFLALQGLWGSHLTIKKQSIPEFLAALGSVASAPYARVGPEPSTSVAELPDDELIEPAGEVQPARSEQVLVQIVTPLRTRVYRVTYVLCAGCQTELRLEHRDDYVGQAILCPQCNHIVLLED